MRIATYNVPATLLEEPGQPKLLRLNESAKVFLREEPWVPSEKDTIELKAIELSELNTRNMKMSKMVHDNGAELMVEMSYLE